MLVWRADTLFFRFRAGTACVQTCTEVAPVSFIIVRILRIVFSRLPMVTNNTPLCVDLKRPLSVSSELQFKPYCEHSLKIKSAVVQSLALYKVCV